MKEPGYVKGKKQRGLRKGLDCGKEGGAGPQQERFHFRKPFLWSWLWKVLLDGRGNSVTVGSGRALALTGTGRTRSGFPARSAMCR